MVKCTHRATFCLLRAYAYTYVPMPTMLKMFHVQRAYHHACNIFVCILGGGGGAHTYVLLSDVLQNNYEQTCVCSVGEVCVSSMPPMLITAVFVLC